MVNVKHKPLAKPQTWNQTVNSNRPSKLFPACHTNTTAQMWNERWACAHKIATLHTVISWLSANAHIFECMDFLKLWLVRTRPTSVTCQGKCHTSNSDDQGSTNRRGHQGVNKTKPTTQPDLNYSNSLLQTLHFVSSFGWQGIFMHEVGCSV